MFRFTERRQKRHSQNEIQYSNKKKYQFAQVPRQLCMCICREWGSSASKCILFSFLTSSSSSAYAHTVPHKDTKWNAKRNGQKGKDNKKKKSLNQSLLHILEYVNGASKGIKPSCYKSTLHTCCWYLLLLAYIIIIRKTSLLFTCMDKREGSNTMEIQKQSAGYLHRDLDTAKK